MNKKAFTLIEILLVITIIGLIVNIVIPKLFCAHQKAADNVCFANRRIIERAEILYLCHRSKHSQSIQDLVDAGYLIGLPKCSSGGIYVWVPYSKDHPNDQIAFCSIHGSSEMKQKRKLARLR